MIRARRHAALAGLALIVLTNAVALAGAAFNRMGESQGTLRLTERELSVPFVWRSKKEDSGLAMQLRWRSLSATRPAANAYGYLDDEGGARPAWLDDRKMASLGFSPTPSGKQPFDGALRHREQPPRDAFIVLELDGPAYQESLRRADEAAAAAAARSRASNGGAASAPELPPPSRSPQLRSRLFAVDAGLDRDALRARYPDRTKYAIVHGRIRPIAGSAAGNRGGAIDVLSANDINVPLPLRPVFDGLSPRSYGDPDKPAARFDATVVFGQRSEPWLASATRR